MRNRTASPHLVTTLAWSYLFTLIFTLIKQVESSIQLKLVTLPENLPGKCLDGTRPVFYVQKPKLKDEKISRKEKFLIFLEGGGWCHEPTVELNTEQFSCDKRKSEPWIGGTADSKTLLYVKNGILASLTFKDYRKVYVRYCDQSSFSGVRQMSLKNGTSVGYGLVNFASVVNWLKNRFGMRKGWVKDLVLAGSSAGGLAVIYRCNDLQKKLHESDHIMHPFC